jgi:hypothetical protein
MRVPRPSPALVVAFLALLLALGGVAFAATGSAVNIVDPSDPSLAAKVDKAGKLEVGDGGVPLTVGGTITTKATTPPGGFFLSTGLSVGSEKRLVDQPTPGAIDITAIHLSAVSIPGQLTRVYIMAWSTSSDCAAPRQSATIAYAAVLFPDQPYHDVTFPSPLVLRPPAGMMECASVLIPAGFSPAWVNVSGFRPSVP